jgi:ubiquinone/menaquinone biosynthesis C-methylase UbiE
VPERELGMLGDVAGTDMVELGCGTARRCQSRFGITFPLVEADAADTPFPDGSFDLAVSASGTTLANISVNGSR